MRIASHDDLRIQIARNRRNPAQGQAPERGQKEDSKTRRGVSPGEGAKENTKSRKGVSPGEGASTKKYLVSISGHEINLLQGGGRLGTLRRSAAAAAACASEAAAPPVTDGVRKGRCPLPMRPLPPPFCSPR